MSANQSSGHLPSEGTEPTREGHGHSLESYRILLADEQLEFRDIFVSDPVPTGRQILHAAGVREVEEFSLFAILPSGDFEDIRLDETYDLRGRGAEKFVLFRTDREFKFFVDGKEERWGKPFVSGLALKKLANVPPEKYNVYQEVRGGQDILIRNHELVDLSKPGVERFITLICDTTEGLTALALPEADQRYLDDHGLVAEVITHGPHTGVVIHGFALPPDKFNHEAADVLILLPVGYPDVPPDMFYFEPWLKMRSTGQYPSKADAAHSFDNRSWQRWSRHNPEWRPGVDGLHTMLKRVERALHEAR
jgi:hypothetical protein